MRLCRRLSDDFSVDFLDVDSFLSVDFLEGASDDDGGFGDAFDAFGDAFDGLGDAFDDAAGDFSGVSAGSVAGDAESATLTRSRCDRREIS